jgi:DNA mismatch repair protein MutL
LAHGDYAIFETQAGVLLIERRAAHERIWFERLQAQFRAGSVPSQRLLLPIPVEMDPISTALLCENLRFLAQHGFEVSEFGRNFFRIESLPTWMEPAVAEVFLRDLLGAIREGRLRPENLEIARDELARLAVARAIRLPEAASEAEMLALAAQLLACRNPLTTPGGRTTYLELSQNELQRRFQR